MLQDISWKENAKKGNFFPRRRAAAQGSRRQKLTNGAIFFLTISRILHTIIVGYDIMKRVEACAARSTQLMCHTNRVACSKRGCNMQPECHTAAARNMSKP